MVRIQLCISLVTLLLSLPTQAARLELADNLTLLASPQGKPSLFARSIELPAGETKLLVRFDSPSDPRSTNESQGRVTSAPLVVNLTLPAQGNVQLTTPPLSTPQAIREFAFKPTLFLSQPGGTKEQLTVQAIPRNQDTLQADYQALLASYSVTPVPTLANPTVSSSPKPNSAATVAEAPATLSAEQADAELRRLYLAADEARRKAFIRWALNL